MVITRTCTLATALCAMLGITQAQTLVTGPSTSTGPYLNSHLTGVTIESLLTVADGTTVPKVGGGTTRLVGIPDGLGAFDNGDGTFTLLVNHEIQAVQGVPRAHGAAGAFVSRWVIDKTTHAVISGEDQIKNFFTWDGSEYTQSAAPALDRTCSADLAPVSALYNSASGLGTQTRIFFNGEETTGGRAMAHVVAGPENGNTYHLPHLGYANFENVLLSPKEQDKTIAVLTDDSVDGGVYLYIGTKNNTGATDVEMAGLVGGKLYSVKVASKPFEVVGATGSPVLSGDTFILEQIGGPGYVDSANAANNDTYPAAGTNTVARAAAAGGLKFAGPEDGCWDTRPGHENKFYFNTKGSSSNGFQANTRLWQLEFNNIANPEAGGTITILADSTDFVPETLPGTRANLDNMCFVSGGKLMLLEDLGGDDRLGRVYEFDLNTHKLEEVAGFGSRFYSGAANFLTNDEEASGIINLENILGPGWFALTAQVHTNTHVPTADRAELVEGGQIMLVNLNDRGSDFVREKAIATGSNWKYDASGADPGHTASPKWYDVAFDDSAWVTGATPIGYGDDNETATDIPLPATPRPLVTYFRRNFTLLNPTDVVYLEVMMQRDDGAVVYINGVEVGRSNVSATPPMSNTTPAASTTSNEVKWVYIPVKAEGLNLGGNNTIAVSVHQDSNTSSDTRMNCEVIAYLRPGAGTAPVIPAGLAAGTTTEVTVPLTWTAQPGVKTYQLERKRGGDNASEVLRYDLPGDFVSYTDKNLTASTQYSYRLKATNVYGASAYTAVLNATTAAPALAPIVFQEDFEGVTPIATSPTATVKQQTFSTLSGITTVNVGGTFNWYPAGPFGSQASGGLGKIVQGNNFGGSGAADDWLILPAVNTAFYTNETFDFKSDARFDDPGLAGLPNTGVPSNNAGLDVLVSTNYNPAIHTNPSSATWTLLPGYALDSDFGAFGSGTPSGTVNLAGIPGIDNGPAYVAFRYRAAGTTSGNARAWEIDQFTLRGNSGYHFQGTLAPFNAVNVASNLNWTVATVGGRSAASANNFAGDLPADDWLITPRMVTRDVSAAISFDLFRRFADNGLVNPDKPLSVLVSTNYDPAVHTSPSAATWTDITGTALNGATEGAWTPLSPIPLGVVSNNVYVAFQYRSSGTGSGSAQQAAIDNLKFYPTTAGGLPVASFAESKNGGEVTFNGTVTGGTGPFTYAWTFGDSTTSTVEDPKKTYFAPGTYSVTFTVTDSLNQSSTVTKTNLFTFTQFAQPAKAVGTVRFESFNAGLNSEAIGTNTFDANAVANALAAGNHPNIKKLAEIVQRVNPDVLFLSEFDIAQGGLNGSVVDTAATNTRIDNLQSNYFGVPQAPGLTGTTYAYRYIPGTNTGIHSGHDLRNNGTITSATAANTTAAQNYGDDAFGFGQYPGKYGFILLSKYPIDAANIRTFQHFLWKDMPGALLPEDPADTDGNSDTASFYTAAERDMFRLSSKNHCDVPVVVNGEVVHCLISHPTPPVFDDGETLTHSLVTGTAATKADWNGLRNYDEIRFWADYVDPAKNGYIYDDAHLNNTGTGAAGNPLYTGTPTGGLPAGARFIVMGDQNADPVDGDTSFDSILPLLNSTLVDSSVAPTSTGAAADVPGSFSNRATKTSDFNLRADYVLPSAAGFETAAQAGCYWPVSTDLTYHLLGASDHRSVWIDLAIISADAAGPVDGVFTVAPNSPVKAGTTLTGDFTDWNDASLPLGYAVLEGETVIIAQGANSAPSFTLPVGSHSLTGRIYDNHGNFTTTGAVTVVVDGAAPVITAPAQVTATASSPLGAVVTFTVSANDDVDSTPTLTVVPPSGSSFVVGTTPVNVTAQDDAGNQSTYSFNVVVGAGSVEYEILSSKGATVPGAGTDPRIQGGAKWTGFGSPAINDASDIAYIGKWSAAAIKGTTPLPAQNGTGVFVNQTLLVKVGENVPGISGTTFKSFRDPVIDNNGRVAFVATIQGTGVSTTNDTVVVSNGRAGAFEVLAREGDSVPDAAGATFKALTSVSIMANEGFSGTLFTATLGGAVLPANDNGAWWMPAGSSTVSKLIRDGDLFGVETIRSHMVLRALGGTASHGRGHSGGDQVILQATLLAGKVSRQAELLATPTGLTEITGTGDTLGGTELPTAKWTKLSLASSGNEGANLSLMGTLQSGVGGVVPANSRGIFVSADQGVNWEPLVRLGDGATGISGAAFRAFRDPANSSTGAALSFIGIVGGSGVLSSNDTGIWYSPDGATLQLVAREGSKPVEAPEGAQWKSFSSLVQPGTPADSGAPFGPIFTATLAKGAGGITSSDDVALYALDRMNTLHELVRENQPLLGKSVKSFRVLKAASGSVGTSRGFNADGKIALLVTFADNTISIVRVSIP